MINKGFEMDPRTKNSFFDEVDPETDKIATQVVDAAIRVHKGLGPGLLENAYEACFDHEIRKRGLKVERQIPVPLIYGDVRLEVGFRLDLLIEDRVVVEVKAVDAILPIHKAQILTYLKISNRELGFLINFNAPILKWGIERIALSRRKFPEVL